MLLREGRGRRHVRCHIRGGPLTALHHQLANFLGLSISQIAPNTWRIFIGAKILWVRLSGGNCQLTLDEFFWCYRPQHIILSQGIYHFAVRKKELKLVSNMPDSNRNWKSRYFFVQGTNWVCRQEEWVTMPHGFDNTWGIIKDSGLILSTSSLFFIYLFQVFNVVYFSHFRLVLIHILQTSKKLSSVGS